MGKDLSYFPHGSVPDFLGSETVELVLGLGEASEDAGGLVPGGLASGSGRSVPGLKSLVASRLDHSVQRLLASEERPFRRL